ncbi:general secretion pathway protein K [mine drainage metagenome]|uniref:General secretion pathway protein K n=1 Tax=mine drainage metagenome TaxID=410659 RepID=A0A1J5RYV6_9ZZZZ
MQVRSSSQLTRRLARTWSRRRGAVLLVVLITILFAGAALTLFMQRANDDLLIGMRDADARRLRPEAYSALETTLAVLEDFIQVNGSLKSPAEGWGDPLNWAGYAPEQGRTVTVDFVDESGKVSLPHVTDAYLVDLFKSWDMRQTDAERVADALMLWMTKSYVPTSDFTPTYDLDPIPFGNPQRPLRTWSELESIDVVKDMFFDHDGQPNDLWRRFRSTFSLFDFTASNINAGNAGLMQELNLDPSQQGKLSDYLAGRGDFKSQGPGYFRTTGDIAKVVGLQAPPSGVGTTIQALRIIITVRDGQGSFRLDAVVSVGGSAKPVTQEAANKDYDSSPDAATASQALKATTTANQALAARTVTGDSTQMPALNYPFTILELRENDELPPTPPPATQADNAKST